MPPAKFVVDGADGPGHAHESMVCSGVVVSGGRCDRSILAPGVFVHSNAEVEGSVLFDGVDVGRHAIVRNAIVDKNVADPRGRPDRRGPGAGPGAVHVSPRAAW